MTTSPSYEVLGRNLIDGEWVEGTQQRPVLDKFRLSPCGTLHVPAPEQIRAAVAAAHRAFRRSTLTPEHRGRILDRAAQLIAEHIDDFTQALQIEGGFPLQDARGEVARCVETFRISADEARRLCGEMIPIEGAPQQSKRLGFTLRVPLGVVCAITPFNAPLNTVAHKIAPALAAGNAVILKPSAHTPTTACLLAQTLLDAGLPRGLLTVLHGEGDVAQQLLDEDAIRFFAFTGSTAVGAEIQRRAGLRRTQMELGSIAFTVLCADADLERALPKIVNSAYRKAGQVCTSIQTLLVHESLIATVEKRLAAMVRELSYGDPLATSTVVGPVISESSAHRIEQWIERAVAGGARLLVGGPRHGAVIPPTLLADVPADASVRCEEVFGPVMSIEPFTHFDGVIARINATPYGLATGLFTQRLDDALRAARELEVGGVHINETSSSRVDLMPYGGTKASGFGCEGPRYAIHEMTETRTITLAT